MADDARDDGVDGLRAANLAVADLRAELHHLAAQVVALIEVVGDRLGAPIDDAVDAAAGPILERLELALERADALGRLELATVVDKYAIDTSGGPPCEELFPICGARCCALQHPLSSQDLDEGVIRWDRGQPYLIAHDAGRCVHQEASTGACTAYAHRPARCRTYDCRDDPRIWIDYAQRIPAPLGALSDHVPPLDPSRLLERERARELALAGEAIALRRRQRTPIR